MRPALQFLIGVVLTVALAGAGVMTVLYATS
jgi:hypothetical protein